MSSHVRKDHVRHTLLTVQEAVRLMWHPKALARDPAGKVDIARRWMFQGRLRCVRGRIRLLEIKRFLRQHGLRPGRF